MDYIDYYQILGLDKSASENDIKKAFRKQARKYHPDLHPNDPDAKRQFQLVNEAHEVLSNPENRKKYDEYGKDWQHADEIEAARKAQAASGRWGNGQQFDEGDFSSFFENLFGRPSGGFGGQQVRFKGRNIQAKLSLRMSDVRETAKRTLEIGGKKIRISVPAGLRDGQTIKLAGHGEPGINGGPSGDLYVTFHLENDIGYRRVGSTLYKSVDIDVPTAVLGGEVTVETLYGKVKLQVTPGTQNGAKVKLKGKGFNKYKSDTEFGDLIVSYNILIPESLTEKERELYEKLRQERHHEAA